MRRCALIRVRDGPINRPVLYTRGIAYAHPAAHAKLLQIVEKAI